jgi:hypothetical protein
MNGFYNWIALSIILFSATVISIILYRYFGKAGAGDVYSQIACSVGGAALGLFGSVMLVDAYHLEGYMRYATIMFIAIAFGIGLQRTILSNEKNDGELGM